jgi:hypothetical protein
MRSTSIPSQYLTEARERSNGSELPELHLGFPQLIVQGVPNWSTSMSKRIAQNVSCNGICTVPFCDKRVEDTFRFRRVFDIEHDGKPLGFLIALRGDIPSLQ